MIVIWTESPMCPSYETNFMSNFDYQLYKLGERERKRTQIYYKYTPPPNFTGTVDAQEVVSRLFFRARKWSREHTMWRTRDCDEVLSRLYHRMFPGVTVPVDAR